MSVTARPISNSSNRKYGEVWKQLKTTGVCILKTTHGDTMTIVNGIKKEKNKDPKRPKDKMLKIGTEETPSKIAGQPSEIKITIRLVEDTSINNL